MLIADENIPGSTVRELRGAGFDALWIAEIGPGSKDEDVLALAVRANRVLITFDRDYGELIFRRGKVPPRNVIYLRDYPGSAAEFTQALLLLLKTGIETFEGKFLIVSKHGIRERRFPQPVV